MNFTSMLLLQGFYFNLTEQIIHAPNATQLLLAKIFLHLSSKRQENRESLPKGLHYIILRDYRILC